MENAAPQPSSYSVPIGESLFLAVPSYSVIIGENISIKENYELVIKDPISGKQIKLNNPPDEYKDLIHQDTIIGWMYYLASLHGQLTSSQL